MIRRRPVVLLALAITSFVLAACSQSTAPQRDDTTQGLCRNGYNTATGEPCA